MKAFEITLKNVKLGKYHLISWILAFINIVTQLYLTFATDFQQHRLIIAPLLVLALIFLIAARGAKFNFRNKREYAATIYILIIVIWIKWELYWAAALTGFFYLLYIYSIRKFKVSIAEDKITYPSFPKKEIGWKELQNIVLKDGILTIDFKNDKLLQNEVESAEQLPDEQKINEFCREQLKK